MTGKILDNDVSINDGAEKISRSIIRNRKLFSYRQSQAVSNREHHHRKFGFLRHHLIESNNAMGFFIGF